MWVKSSKCGNGACIEVDRDDQNKVLIRTKPNGPVLDATADEWAAFVQGVKNGEFDR